MKYLILIVLLYIVFATVIGIAITVTNSALPLISFLLLPEVNLNLKSEKDNKIDKNEK